jgi:hypothetical protein
MNPHFFERIKRAKKEIISIQTSSNGGNVMKTNLIDYSLLALVIIGALNWGLIGFFGFDLVAFIFGDMSWFSRIIYAIVGIAGIYMFSLFGRINSQVK